MPLIVIAKVGTITLGRLWRPNLHSHASSNAVETNIFQLKESYFDRIGLDAEGPDNLLIKCRVSLPDSDEPMNSLP